MSTTHASAPGKIILFGEHAVVYGRPAIAAPLPQVRAEAFVEDSESGGVYLTAPDLNWMGWLRDSSRNDPFAQAVRVTLDALNIESEPSLSVSVTSQIPIASGLGSGAAMAAAVIRAIYNHLSPSDRAGNQLVSTLTYQVERILHGTPSGIDNSVVSEEKPIFFKRERPHNLLEFFQIGSPMMLLVANTGVSSRTKDVVGDVRRQWKERTKTFEALFDRCGQIALAAREAIEEGDLVLLGSLMNENQIVLQELTVSSEELERLISAAIDAGAYGAKLSGAGRGGNMIALVGERSATAVRDELLSAGAVAVIESQIT